MKTIIAGCRYFKDYEVISEFIENNIDWEITEVVSGRARGVDTLGEIWAERHDVGMQPFDAQWDKYGRKRAGPIRNQKMADYAEALIAFPTQRSIGTRDMIRRAKKQGLRVIVCEI